MHALVRSLGLKETTALVVGTIIGTGVFLKTAVMAQTAGSPTGVILAWAVAGLLSLAGALTYAELGSLFPKAGGEYIFMREIYGPLAGFLYGWTRFWIGSPGSIAAYAVGASTFLEGLIPRAHPWQGALIAMGLIGLFTVLNCFTVAFGGRLQTVMTVLKVAMILGLIAAVFGGTADGGFHHFFPESGTFSPSFSAFGATVVAALWAFDGWNNMPMAAGEIKDPERVIPRALGLGLLFIFGLYVAANAAYFYALPFAEVLAANSTAYPDALPVATKAAQAAFGPLAVSVLSAAFVFSALGAMNGSVLTGARVPFAMAHDGVFFRALGRVHPKSKVPVTAILAQGVWAAVLAASGTFDQLTDSVVFSSWIFYFLAALGLLRLRRSHPHWPRSFHVPLYPYLPLGFMAVSAWLLFNTLLTSPVASGLGLLFMSAGVPAYLLFFRAPVSSLTESAANRAEQ